MERIRLWNVTKESDDDLAFAFMLKQYGAVIARQIAANGEEYVIDRIRAATEGKLRS